MVRIIENSGLLSEANPYHGRDGRFASKGAGGGIGAGGYSFDDQMQALTGYALGEDGQVIDSWLKLSHGNIDAADDIPVGSQIPAKDLRGNRAMMAQVHTIDSAFDNPKLTKSYPNGGRVYALPGENPRNGINYSYTLASTKKGTGPAIDLPKGAKVVDLSKTKVGGKTLHPNQDALLLPRDLHLTKGADGAFSVGHAAIIEANPYHDARGRFASRGVGAGYGGAETLDEAIGNATDDIRGMKGGEAAIVLNDDGTVAFTKSAQGDPDGPGPGLQGMTFSQSEVDRMTGKVHIHNHPTTDVYGDLPASFSEADLRFTYQVRPKEMVIADHSGTTYTMKPGPDGWGPGFKVEQAITKARTDAARKYTEEWHAGHMSLSEANSKAADEAAREVANQMGWSYEVK